MQRRNFGEKKKRKNRHFLQLVHKNYSNVKICLYIAQLTNTCGKLNTLH